MNCAATTIAECAFAENYRRVLKDYVSARIGEEALMDAYNLGRRAVSEHCNILDLIALHQEVILQEVLSGGADQQAEHCLGRGEEFLAEVMAPFEMMHRGFVDTIQQLQEMNATLERRVTERTRDLRESQRRSADLARLYQILSYINSAIVRQHSRSELFKEACRIAVDQGGYQAAGINLAGSEKQSETETWCHHDADGSRCMAAPAVSLSAEFIGAVNQLYSEAKPQVRRRDVKRCLTAADSNGVVCCSFALLPLQLDGRVIGVLSLLSADPQGFNPEEMRLLLEMAGDLSFALDHINKEEQLNYLAYYDSLTGLPNLSLLLEHLPMRFQAAMRVDHLVAVVMVDLVRFSDVNDTYGRHVGDILLKQVASRLQQATDNRETVARIGADRFVLSLTEMVDTDRIGHRLEQEVLRCFQEPFVVEGTEIHVTAQFGVSLFPSDGTDPDVLYKNAEIALKRAQSHGDPYLLYDSAMHERIIHSVTMETKIRKAIENGELVLYYQPKISTVDKRLVGVEALLRYADPEMGLILPGNFIPLMEESSMIIDIGKWVIGRAAADLGHWRQQNLEPPRVAFNVSPVQLRQRDFIESLREMLPSGRGNHGLDIEITESAVMDDVAANIPKLQAVRELGFGIAIDDFGTGYSSLSYLSRLPATSLKIDRSFIIDMTEQPNSLAIVTTIITLAHALDLEVVAEGVDREEQAKLLRLLRCDLIQGNLYSPPLPREQITRLLQSRRPAPSP